MKLALLMEWSVHHTFGVRGRGRYAMKQNGLSHEQHTWRHFLQPVLLYLHLEHPSGEPSPCTETSKTCLRLQRQLPQRQIDYS